MTITQNIQVNNSVIALGTNIGDRQQNLETAIEKLKSFSKIKKKSSIYLTSPVGYDEQEDFLNMVIEIETNLEANTLLEKCQNIEIEIGRKKEFINGPRIIDLDILFFENQIIKSENLIIPHPQIENRLFVLEPLNQIKSDYIHPVIQLDINTLLSKLKPISDERIKKTDLKLEN